MDEVYIRQEIERALDEAVRWKNRLTRERVAEVEAMTELFLRLYLDAKKED